ncbi:hypothetical protein NQ315_015004 [Exocentrus adspersus]|uniref:Uncharacterized protein n=1 Tax=Exocentrus adspersus TaxID=1586481 RepID=A0AAV8VWS1_9CUCU|nr:hypothetical protein NQ315_015004 [Exocentrus adspersus]
MDLFRPKTVRIYQFKGTCPEYEDVPIRYSDIQLVTANRTMHISMKITLLADVDSDMKLWLFLKRCTSRDSLDTCETYNTIKINHFCRILNAKNKPWTMVVDQITPPVKCPLKKGDYEVKNSTFDGSAFDRFPVVNWYWMITVHLRDETTNEVLLCAFLEGQVAPI